METFVFFLASEVTIAAITIQARKRLYKKWLEGKLSLQELESLKEKKWFRQIWQPTKEKVSKSKKTN